MDQTTYPPSRWPTSAAMFQQWLDAPPDAAPFKRRGPEGWGEVSWRELRVMVEEIGAGALAWGLQAGDAAAILASTSPEWLAIDMALQGAGLVTAGLYPTDPPPKIAYVLQDCRARVVFVDTDEQVEKLRRVRDGQKVELVVVLHAAAVPDEPGFMGLEAWRALGRAALKGTPDLWRAAGAAVDPEATAILIYTSGTTGPPKGAMISHRALAYQISHAPQVFGIAAGWSRPAFLPLCHVAERLFSYFSLATGGTSWFVDGPVGLIRDLPQIRPQLLLGVPRVYEKIQAAGEAWLAGQSADQATAVRADLARSLASLERGDGPLADTPPLRSLRTAIGADRAQAFISGGARFPEALMSWMHAIGAPVRELYGMTECGCLSTQAERPSRGGMVGRPCAFGDLSIAEDGEVRVRGPHLFSGYLNLPEKTAEVLRNGWFHTGDVGELDAEGRLILLDRIKDIIISSSGKNITPSEIESALKASPFISDAVAVGDGRHYVTALILIDRSAVEAALAAQGERCADFADLAAHPRTQALVAEAVAEANARLSRPESVRKFRILPQEFGPADEVMTPTLKIKRSVLIGKFQPLVDEMYAASHEPARMEGLQA